MRDNWLLFMDIDGGPPYDLPLEIFLTQGLVGNFPGRSAFQEAYKCISKFTGAFLVWFASGSSHRLPRSLSGKRLFSKFGSSQSCSLVKQGTSLKHNLMEWYSGAGSREQSSVPVLFGKIANSTVTHIWKELKQLQSFPVLSLAGALVPPFDNLSRKVLSMPVESSDVLMNRHMDQTPCVCGRQQSADLAFRNWSRDAVEPVTGINFPTVLDNTFGGGYNSPWNSEVLVGTGTKGMKIFKVKSLKVYAFGLYVQPGSICKKLGSKYASVPLGELNSCTEFFDDLLRQDINMSVRLVVNINGLKISAVRDAFEKSLRARLVKMNPNTDYHCLRTFDSYFSQDIPLPPGTVINFQQTADGQLVTEIGGKQMGVVHSKDLCRAFFGMYIGDGPVSEQAKEEIAKNVGGIIKRC